MDLHEPVRPRECTVLRHPPGKARARAHDAGADYHLSKLLLEFLSHNSTQLSDTYISKNECDNDGQSTDPDISDDVDPPSDIGSTFWF